MKTWKVEKHASKGYAIGPAFIVKQMQIDADSKKISTEEIEAEIELFHGAVSHAENDLKQLAETSDIFMGHLALVTDFALLDGVKGKVKNQLDNAQMALKKTCDEFVMMFESMEDEYMRERAADMKDVCRRLMFALKGIDENPFADMNEPSIVVAKDLAPSDTAKMDMKKVLGFLTEEGGVTSHVSIIAKNMGIPCLVGVGSLLNDIHTGDTLIMDAGNGDIMLSPEESDLASYREKAEKFAEHQKKLEEMSTLPSVTEDGKEFELCANVGNIPDIQNALEYQIDGVGLFRSEFLYMENTHFPTEEEQFEVYKQAAVMLDGKELTIRTLDIGGDKGLDYFTFPEEENPFLGYRAIRISLDKEELLYTQLRALLRASAYGYIRIMYPMIISLEELKKAAAILDECKAQLKSEGIAFDETIKTGMMIETPAAVLMAEQFAKYVDFFSIGTNDLTQYVLAVDRGNQKISSMYNSFHPAVLRAIYHTIQAGHKQGIKIGMCGEFASDEKASILLLGMGLDEFSMSAGEIAVVKYRLRQSNFEQAQQMAKKVMECETIEQVMELLD